MSETPENEPSAHEKSRSASLDAANENDLRRLLTHCLDIRCLSLRSNALLSKDI